MNPEIRPAVLVALTALRKAESDLGGLPSTRHVVTLEARCAAFRTAVLGVLVSQVSRVTPAQAAGLAARVLVLAGEVDEAREGIERVRARQR